MSTHISGIWFIFPAFPVKQVCKVLPVLLLFPLLFSSPLQAAPRVVVSITPIHSLVAGVMEGVAEPALLIASNASPHGYALRPSEARMLSRAELVVWVGEGLETTLLQPLNSLADKARIIELAEADGMNLLSGRKGGVWEAYQEHTPQGHDHKHEHGHKHAHKDHHADKHDAHDHGEYDSHLWLSPANARRIVELLRDVLSEMDPDNTDRYHSNAITMLQKMAATQQSLAAQLAPFRGRPYIVFHDAYQYFEESFGLNPAGAITLSPERAPGARRIAEIRQVIAERQAVCVFSEPQFRPAVVKVVLEGSQARQGELDPLGSTLAPGAEQWFQLMQGLADSLQQCLAHE